MYSDLCLLISEDDRQVRDAIRRGVSARGFRVQTSDTVLGSLDLFAKADIAIIDLTLTNGDGRQVLQEWVAKKHAPVVIISRGISRGETEDMLLSGAWFVFDKPFSWEAFYLVLERYAHIVRDKRTCQTVKKLRRRVTLLSFMVVAMGGVQVIPWILSL